MGLLKSKVKQSAFLHFRDATGELIYLEDKKGKPDKTKPVGVWMYGPGSPQQIEVHNEVESAAISRMMPSAFRKKSRSKEDDDSAADYLGSRERKIEVLTRCTERFENVDDIVDAEGKPLTGAALAKAVWGDACFGFLIPQADSFIGSWANFIAGSATS